MQARVRRKQQLILGSTAVPRRRTDRPGWGFQLAHSGVVNSKAAQSKGTAADWKADDTGTRPPSTPRVAGLAGPCISASKPGSRNLNN